MNLEKRKQKDRIKHPDMLLKIGELYTSGMSFSEIARTISTELGFEVSTNEVKRVFEVYSCRRKEMVQADENIKDIIKKQVLDTTHQLKQINKEVWKMVEKAEKEGMKLAALKELRLQLEFQEKMVSRLTDAIKNPTINKIEQTQIIINKLDEFEKAGLIKILHPQGTLPELPTEEPKTIDAEFEDTTDS